MNSEHRDIKRLFNRERKPVFPEVGFQSLRTDHHLQFSHYHKADIVVVNLHQQKKPPLLCHSHTCTYLGKQHI